MPIRSSTGAAIMRIISLPFYRPHSTRRRRKDGCEFGRCAQAARFVALFWTAGWELRNADLQTQYTSYKNTLQSLAQKVGEIEQEIEEHK